MAFFFKAAQAARMKRPRGASGQSRRFLFLQGPHGPFFAALSRALRASGADCRRVGFNGGDRLFWRGRDTFIAYRGRPEDWPRTLDDLLVRHGITDVVLYGETRPVHAAAVGLARSRGLTVHIFEEGYLRPYWATYERDGANGRSRIVSLSIDEMRQALTRPAAVPPAPADRWGDMREHMVYGALYHGAVLLGPRPSVPTHRDQSVAREFRLHLRRLLLTPVHAAGRRLATDRIIGSGAPYHVALLQLEHDPTLRFWSPFGSMTGFIDTVTGAFAEGAPPHHHLVFKAHPLEDGRVPLLRVIRAAADRQALTGRVHFVRGGKLARLLEGARSAVTVNSTAAQQALWRGLPVKCFGTAVYAKPELVSGQPLTDFFAAPRPPDPDAYADFRRFLVETSQIGGGFYSLRGRARLLRHVVDMMLDPRDRYDRRVGEDAAASQQLRLVG